MAKYDTFDWDEARNQRNSETVEFYQENYKTAMTEDEFVEGMKDIPRVSKAGNLVARNDHRLRRNYQHLKKRFGFFTGELQ